jgi:hypothetical protein
MMRYVTSRKDTGSSPDEASAFFNLHNSASIRNEYQNIFLGSKALPARKADNITTICEPIVKTMWDPQHLTIL